MSYLVNEVALGSGVSSGTVVFDTAFSGIPPLVIAVVRNISAPPDSPLLQINAYPENVSNTGFDFSLDGITNTANYVLTYIAGSPDLLFAAITAVGKRLTQWPRFTGVPSDQDLFPMAVVSPIAQSKAVAWGTLKTWFVRKLAAVPTAPTDTAGDMLGLAIDDDYLYVRFSTGTARIPLSKTAWAISDIARKRITASHTCTTDQVQVVTFGATFPGVPRIICTIRNTAAAAKSVLFGIVTAVTTTGFEFTLNAAPGSAGEPNNYFLDYEAVY